MKIIAILVLGVVIGWGIGIVEIYYSTKREAISCPRDGKNQIETGQKERFLVKDRDGTSQTTRG